MTATRQGQRIGCWFAGAAVVLLRRRAHLRAAAKLAWRSLVVVGPTKLKSPGRSMVFQSVCRTFFFRPNSLG